MANNNQAVITCGDILLMPGFKEAVVLAGMGGMHRGINRVNVMEVPDVIDWVRPGEFLITSGFPFRDQPEAIADMIPQLVEKGVAALGIKTKRFIEMIPPQALELANQLHFPVFELPASTVFSDVVRDIMERVLVTEARELSLLQSRFQKLSQQLLYGKGMDEFLQTLDGMLNNPVILLDDSDHLYLSPQAGQLEQANDSAVWSRLRFEASLGVSFITIGDRRIRVYVSEVNDKRHEKCLLILVEWNQEHSMVDQLTIDRVGILVGLEMINVNARREVELKYIDQFLQDWISGRIVTMEDLRIRAEASGSSLDHYSFMHVGLVRWLDVKPSSKQLLQTVRRLRSRSLGEGLQATLLEGELILLIPSTPPAPQHVLYERLAEELRSQYGSQGFSLCVGKTVDRPDRVWESYDDVKKIKHISANCNYDEPYIDYKGLGVYQLLYHLPDTDEVMDFRDRFIAPLLEYDQKHHSQFYETMKIYFKCNRNVKKTAAKLITHYNTVSYRVERVCEIVGIDMNDGDDLFQLYLAMKLNEMRSK